MNLVDFDELVADITAAHTEREQRRDELARQVADEEITYAHYDEAWADLSEADSSDLGELLAFINEED